MGTSGYKRIDGYVLAVFGIALPTVAYKYVIHGVNTTTIALSYLLVVLLVASARGLAPSIVASISGMLCFNFFFLPPVGNLTIQDPQNWVALSAFLVTAFVASQLSSAARSRAEEAEGRREEVWRLYQLSRAIISTPDTETALSRLAMEVKEIFALEYCGIFLPADKGWNQIAHSGQFPVGNDMEARDTTLRQAFNSGMSLIRNFSQIGGEPETSIAYAPLKIGVRPTGVAMLSFRLPLDSGTVDAIGGLIALAIERARLLKEMSETEALRQSDDLKSALLASVSHDLRTPLTSIRAAIDNILHQGITWDADSLRELHVIISEEVEKLIRLVENLLEMARIEAGELKITREFVPLAELLSGIAQRCSAATRNHHLKLDMNDEGVLVKIDSLLISQAFANLVENAAKYSPAGSDIVLKSQVEGDNLILSVADHGPGVSPEESVRLFEKFYRTANSKRSGIPGTGMGLAISRGIVTAHGGSVWVKPNEGGGTVFGFTLPVELKRVPAAAEPAVKK